MTTNFADAEGRLAWLAETADYDRYEGCDRASELIYVYETHVYDRATGCWS